MELLLLFGTNPMGCSIGLLDEYAYNGHREEKIDDFDDVVCSVAAWSCIVSFPVRD
jgi:hypothetical protein